MAKSAQQQGRFSVPTESALSNKKTPTTFKMVEFIAVIGFFGLVCGGLVFGPSWVNITNNSSHILHQVVLDPNNGTSPRHIDQLEPNEETTVVLWPGSGTLSVSFRTEQQGQYQSEPVFYVSSMPGMRVMVSVCQALTVTHSDCSDEHFR